jgi:hypothetical protein
MGIPPGCIIGAPGCIGYPVGIIAIKINKLFSALNPIINLIMVQNTQESNEEKLSKLAAGVALIEGFKTYITKDLIDLRDRANQIKTKFHNFERDNQIDGHMLIDRSQYDKLLDVHVEKVNQALEADI